MKTARQLSEEVLVERYAERGLLRLVSGVTSKHIAKINGFPTSCTVFDEKGNKIDLHIENINERAWNKYQAQRDAPLELGMITGNFIPTVRDVMSWLQTRGYSDRYTYARSISARRLLLNGSLLLVASHFMTYKYREHQFIDSWTECEMGRILTVQEFSNEMFKSVMHAKKHDEDLQEAIEAVYQKQLDILADHAHVPYERLPALPSGVIDPLAFPDEESEEDE